MAVSQSVSLTQTSQSVDGNYSYVTFKWTSTQSGDSRNNYTRTAYYYVSINGGAETKYSVSYTLPANTTKTIVSTSIKVPHKADGTGSIKVRTYMSTNISAGVVEKSVSKTLTTIPRATTPTVSASSVEFGESVTVNMSRASSSFTHTLKYTFSGSTKTIASDLGTSKSWTVPLELMDKIPNATSGTLTFTCETYNGSTKIGSKTVNITVKVPSTVVPTASITITEYVDNIKNTFGVYVKGLSRLNISATGSGAYSSTIKSYKITANGETFTGSSATTSVLNTSGIIPINVTVTDSRGRSITAIKTITVRDYNKPIIDVFEGVRCDEDGTENDDGGNVLLTLKGSVTNLTGNKATYKVGYKESTSNGDYTYTTLNVTSLSINQTHIIKNIDANKSYYIRFIISDAIGDGEPLTIPISTAFTLVDYHSSGKGMSIGKVAEHENLLDIGLPTRFLDTVDILPVGSVFTTSTNESPESRLGGTWELVDKGLKRVFYNSDDLAGLITLGTNTSSATARILVDGDNVIGKITMVISSSFLETDRTALTINYGKLGIVSIPFDALCVGGSDDGNGVVFGILGYSSGNIIIQQAITIDGNSIASGSTITITFNTSVSRNNMVDEYCDRFYWKRTA